jgi:hypothetical protein
MMGVSMTFKQLFAVIACAWILLWLMSALTIGSLMGDSVPQLLFFVGMAFLPPALLYLLLFRALPGIIRKLRKPATHP